MRQAIPPIIESSHANLAGNSRTKPGASNNATLKMAFSLPRDDTIPLAVEELLAVEAAVALGMHRTPRLPETTPGERCCTTPVPVGTFGPGWLHARAAALTILRQCILMVCSYTIAPPCGDTRSSRQGRPQVVKGTDCFLSLQLNGMGFLWVYSDEVAVLDRQAFSDETAAAHAQEAHLAGTSTEGSRLMMASDSSWPQQDQHASM